MNELIQKLIKFQALDMTMIVKTQNNYGNHQICENWQIALKIR